MGVPCRIEVFCCVVSSWRQWQQTPQLPSTVAARNWTETGKKMGFWHGSKPRFFPWMCCCHQPPKVQQNVRFTMTLSATIVLVSNLPRLPDMLQIPGWRGAGRTDCPSWMHFSFFPYLLPRKQRQRDWSLVIIPHLCIRKAASSLYSFYYNLKQVAARQRETSWQARHVFCPVDRYLGPVPKCGDGFWRSHKSAKYSDISRLETSTPSSKV